MLAQGRRLHMFLAGLWNRENERRHRHSGIHRHYPVAEQELRCLGLEPDNSCIVSFFPLRVPIRKIGYSNK
jgi:hypothetical protein